MGTKRTQKKFCDFRCWHAKGIQCSCWCGGMNHGIGYVPAGFDPKKGMSEEEYEGLISRDHAPTADELRELARNLQSGSLVFPNPRVRMG